MPRDSNENRARRRARSSTGNNSVQDEGLLKQSRREIRCWCLTFTVSGNGRVLTEDVELQDGLVLAHYVLGAADDQPAVVVGREVGQGEVVAALCLQDLDVETSKRPRIPKIKSVGRRHKDPDVHTHIYIIFVLCTFTYS